MANYVSLENLQLYDEKIKALISSDDAVVLQSSKDYADSLAVNYATATQGAIAEANAQAIVQLQEDLEAIEDKYLDPNANNKYNVETDKIELYVTNGEYEQIIYRYALLKLTKSAVFNEDVWPDVIDSEGNRLNVEVTADNFKELAEMGLLYVDLGWIELSYPNAKSFYVSNENMNYAEVVVPEGKDIGHLMYDYIDNGYDVFISPQPATKIEVDMKELDEKIVSIVEKATSEDIEKLFA